MITEDNLVVNIDTVIYFQVTDAKAASYEIANYIQAIEQLTVTTLRNVIGGMALEKTLTSRDEINSQLRGVLDEATGKWGIRVNRVELKAIDPPALDQGLDGEADARGPREARRDPPGRGREAGGDPHGRGREAGGGAARRGPARGDDPRRPRARRRRSTPSSQAIHEGNPDPQLLAYQYVQALPQIAQGDVEQGVDRPGGVPAARSGRIGGATGRRREAERSAALAGAGAQRRHRRRRRARQVMRTSSEAALSSYRVSRRWKSGFARWTSQYRPAGTFVMSMPCPWKNAGYRSV